MVSEGYRCERAEVLTRTKELESHKIRIAQRNDYKRKTKRLYVEQTRAGDDWQHVLFVSSDISEIFQVWMIVVADKSFRTESSLWDKERRESQWGGLYSMTTRTHIPHTLAGLHLALYYFTLPCFCGSQFVLISTTM